MSKKRNGYRIRQGFVPYTEIDVPTTGFMETSHGTLKKQGKFVILNFEGVVSSGTTGVINIPKEYAPKTQIIMNAQVNGVGVLYAITTDGKIQDFDSGAIVLIHNIGWETEEKEAING